jgi:hypothetical protein
MADLPPPAGNRRADRDDLIRRLEEQIPDAQPSGDHDAGQEQPGDQPSDTNDDRDTESNKA